MKIIYDTVSDTISVAGLDKQETKVLDDRLSEAFSRNDPIMTVAATVVAEAHRLSASHD